MHYRTIILLLTAGLTTAACTSDEEKIEKVAYKYSYAMANYNVDGAEKYATPETRETTLFTARGLLTKVDPNYIKSDTPATIEITNIQMVDDTSAVATYHKTTPIKDFSATLEVRKRHGRWLAHSPIPVIEASVPEMQTVTKEE